MGLSLICFTRNFSKERDVWFETISFNIIKIISDETFTVQININKNTCQIKENSHIKKDVKCYIMRKMQSHLMST